jgi:hypothetical protein
MATLAEMLRQTGYAKDGQLEAPAPTQPNLSTMAGDYFKQLPAKTAQNAIDMNYMVQNAMPYNPQTGKFDTGPTFSEFANYVPNMMGSVANVIPAAQRMLTAQKNAALPISEGGLGLPATNTATQRAQAMGYDMPMYHGTDTPFIEAFDPEKTKIIKGIFSTNNPKTASKYAEEAGLKKRAEAMGMESSPNVLPLLIKSESHKRIPKFDKQTIDEFRNYADKGVYRDEMGVAVTFDPSQIRSRFAAFDPKQANSPNILAGGLAVPMVDEDTRKATLEKLFKEQK